MNNTNLSKHLKKKLQFKGYSVKSFAKQHFDGHYNTIRNYINEPYKMPLNIIIKMCYALEVDFYELTDIPRPKDVANIDDTQLNYIAERVKLQLINEGFTVKETRTVGTDHGSKEGEAPKPHIKEVTKKPEVNNALENLGLR